MRLHYLFPLLCLQSLITIFPAQAQIQADNSLNTRVTQLGNFSVIDGGTARGKNLFHSFSDFSVPENGLSFFNPDASFENVITRVTGNNLSRIDGILAINGDGNFFLFNPNGVAFGSNSQVILSGSFIASTAESITFSDGTVLPAVSQTPMLSMGVPTGLQLGRNPGSILHQGTNGLLAQSENTIAFVGGDITLDQGVILTPDSRFELFAAADTFVPVTTVNNQLQLATQPQGSIWRDITLTNNAQVITNGNGKGSIQLQGRNILIKDGTQLRNSITGNFDAGTVGIYGSESITLEGRSRNGTTRVESVVDSSATGRGSDFKLKTKQLTISNGARVITATNGAGQGGDIDIQADDLSIHGDVRLVAESEGSGNAGNLNIQLTGNLVLKGIDGAKPEISTETEVSGQGGNLTIVAKQVFLENGAIFDADTEGSGIAGDIKITAQKVALTGTSDNGFGSFISVESDSTSTETAQGGNLIINTNELLLSDNATLEAITKGKGKAGNIDIQAQLIQIDGALESPKGEVSAIRAGVDPHASGQGGNITLKTNRLELVNGGGVSSTTSGLGDGGTINIDAQSIHVSGTTSTGNPSSISAAVNADGLGVGGQVNIKSYSLRVSDRGEISGRTEGAADGGNVRIEAKQLSVNNGGQITSATSGAGNAGNIELIADAIDVQGASADGSTPSRITARSNSEFAAGSVTLSSQSLTVGQQGEISVSNLGSGNSGLLQIKANEILLDQGGILRAEVNGGNQGNIQLQARDTVTLRRGASIVANATGASSGGNVDIDTKFVLAVSSENSDISANAENSFGGQVTIAAQGIIGLEPRDRPTEKSDITVTSSLGTAFSGILDISTQAVDPSKSLASLSEDVLEGHEQVKNTCNSNSGNTFKVTGSGGGNPANKRLPSSLWVDRRPTPSRPQRWSSNLPEGIPTVVKEARGWSRDHSGNLTFMTASSNRHTPQSVAKSCGSSAGEKA